MRAVLLVALLLAAGVAGCMASGPSPEKPSCPSFFPFDVWQSLPGVPSEADPRQSQDALFLVRGSDLSNGVRIKLTADDLANGTHVGVYGEGKPFPLEQHTFPSDLPQQRLIVATLNASETGRGYTARVHRVPLPGCPEQAFGTGLSAGDLGKKEGTILTPGHGAHVFYAGFWENGTLFETNIKGFDQNAAPFGAGLWPRAGWYQSAPYDPLPVYVYDQSRSEEPAYWKPLPGVPGTGTPVDGPIGVATSAPGVGYYSTIKGFNDGLKGLSTTSARVIHMNATDAYPAGTANNPLAGANLVFYVYLQDVVDCPMPRPNGTQLPGAVPCPASP